MKLYAPHYYQSFRCIADACEHSCCIGWEIDIDKETLKAYKKLKGGYGARVRDSISMSGTPHFRLCADGRCPHLDERGLCRIILTLGEDYLSDICREHPRFYNYTDAVEMGLGMSCPEAARIILSSPDYAVMDELGDLPAEPDGIPFSGRSERAAVYALLSGAQDRRSALDSILHAYSLTLPEDGHVHALLGSMEYLDPAHKAAFMAYSSALPPQSPECEVYLERFLAYLIFRHCTEGRDAEDFARRLAFCLLCEQLLASLIAAEGDGTLPKVAALAAMISEEVEYSEENTSLLMG